MKLTQLAAKPQLVKITIDDEEIVKEYGEALDFWIYDRQPIEKFIKLATVKDDNMMEIVGMINEMILDEDGTHIIKDGLSLPTQVMTKVVAKVVEKLGK